MTLELPGGFPGLPGPFPDPFWKSSWETRFGHGPHLGLQKSLRERFRRHPKRSCALLQPVSLHKSASDAFWAPFWDPLDPKIYAPVEARA